MFYEVIFIITSVWILFFGGAAKLENTLLGYMEFGRYGGKESFIKGLVYVSLAVYAFKKLIL